jgi:hypothetical protein
MSSALSGEKKLKTAHIGTIATSRGRLKPASRLQKESPIKAIWEVN